MTVALPTETVQAAAEKMVLQHVGAIIVVDDAGKPIGILTDRDIVCRVLAGRRDPRATSIQEVMSTAPVTIRVGGKLDEAVFTMRQKGVRRLPVVTDSGQAIGMVSLDDLLVLLAGELGQTAATVQENRGP